MLNPSSPSSPANILFVDDEEPYLYAATKSLRSAGFNVTAVADYQKALDVLVSDKPVDLLLSDVVMPKGINGFALSRMARMRRLDLKVLYLTAHDVPKHEAAGKVLRKPITNEDLVKEVQLAIEEVEQERKTA